MLESIGNKPFEYKRLSKEEMEKRGILGRLTGVIADTKSPTRNGRKYSEELWEKVFNDPIMEEKLQTRTCFGELGHPSDRTETDMEKIAICLAEKPKKSKDGKLYGIFDILDTPNGRILKTMCDYGCSIGVSSRGEGEVTEDYDGNESVEPDSYSCECWDAVLLPAVKDARVSLVTESLDKKRYNKTLRQSLTEELNKADEDSKKIMTETLSNLNLDLNESKEEDEKEKAYLDKVEQVVTTVCDAAKVLGEEISKEDLVDRIKKFKYDSIREYVDDLLNDIFDITQSKSKESVEIKEKLKEFQKPLKEIRWDGLKEIDNLFTEWKYPAQTILVNDDELDKFKNDPVDNLVKGKVDSIKLDDSPVIEESIGEEGTPLAKEELECNSEDCSDKKEEKEIKPVVDNKDNMTEELQTALKESALAKAQLVEMQNKLAVGDTKTKELEESLDKYKQLTIKLSEQAKESRNLSKKVLSLEESLKEKEVAISNRDETINQLNESNKLAQDKVKKVLTESTSKETNKINSLNEELTKSKQEIKSLKESYESKLSDLKESYDKLKTESESKEKETVRKISNMSKLVEDYKKAANVTMDKFIETKARTIRVSKEEIKDRLPKSYTFDDVERVVESLQNLQLTKNTLPFSVSNTSKVKFKESSNDKLRFSNNGDDIDDDLLALANLK